ncbi:putative conserved flavoprotein [Trypanosoma grayi]|uniref:putative conserved flavoprotein n=1 Tax=Trypanosoma grayi TaxID=71804 RepID=UPI0004F4987D|nr:putative conserved flavoprotein [Trypanosoma grayi]KEG09972.1 putative conserved flavoprotein [Trypanosoma grayi]
MMAAKAPVKILLLVTGSIAAVKVGLLVDQLFEDPCQIRIASTRSAFHFLTRAQQSVRDFPLHRVLTDDDEWKEWQGMNDAVMHIELRRWADLVVIAPLDANTLAKLSNGLCDNLVTCVMRAWEVKQKPVIVCPAMNTAMWTHPVTAKQLSTLRDWYAHTSPDSPLSDAADDDVSATGQLPDTFEKALFQIVGPVRKRLACGDIGIGGMAPVEDIAKVIRHTMGIIRSRRPNGTSLETDAVEQQEQQQLKEPHGASSVKNSQNE